MIRWLLGRWPTMAVCTVAAGAVMLGHLRAQGILTTYDQGGIRGVYLGGVSVESVHGDMVLRSCWTVLPLDCRSGGSTIERRGGS